MVEIKGVYNTVVANSGVRWMLDLVGDHFLSYIDV